MVKQVSDIWKGRVLPLLHFVDREIRQSNRHLIGWNPLLSLPQMTLDVRAQTFCVRAEDLDSIGHSLHHLQAEEPDVKLLHESSVAGKECGYDSDRQHRVLRGFQRNREMVPQRRVAALQ